MDSIFYHRIFVQTKDLMPLVGRDKGCTNHVRVQGAVGLPWAAHCGRFATQLMHAEAEPTMTKVLSYDRPFFIPRSPQHPLLKSIVFGLSNAKAMFL